MQRSGIREEQSVALPDSAKPVLNLSKGFIRATVWGSYVCVFTKIAT